MARRRARTDLLAFIELTKPDYVVAPHHRLIAEALHKVDAGEIDRLMIFMPPRHGKSEIVSRRFPAWFLGRKAQRQFIGASYGQRLADDFGREARNIVGSPEYGRIFPDATLATDSFASNRWHNAAGGVYVAAGVGGPITGRGADVLSIDDPFKDREEANSEVIRESVWNWYTSTAYTRLMPGGAIIVTMTRWHQDDLAGRLLEEQERGGDRWHVLSLPAVSDEWDALWPDRYPAPALARIRAAIGERDWSALYQQSPRPSEGSLFKTAMLGTVEAGPIVTTRVRRWDLAATRQVGTRDPDWTVGVLMGRTAEGRYVVEDVIRLRGGPDEVEATILATAQRDGRAVKVGIPQDPGQAGVAQVQSLTRLLAGFQVEATRETGDKATRAAPFASQVNVGNVSAVRAVWNRAFTDELSAFPSGSHDDQVDAAAGAFAMLTEPQPIAPHFVSFNLHRR